MSGIVIPFLGSPRSSSSVVVSLFPCASGHCFLESSQQSKSSRATTKKKDYTGIYKTLCFQVSFVLSAFKIHDRTCKRYERFNPFCCRCTKSLLKQGSDMFPSNKVNVLLTTQEHGKLGWFRPQDGVKSIKVIEEKDALPDRWEVLALEGVDRNDDLQNNGVLKRFYEVSAEEIENPNYVEEVGAKLSMEKKDNIGSDTKTGGRWRSKQWLERVDKTAAGGRVKITDLFGDFPSLHDFDSLLYALVKARKLEAAISLFSEMISYGFSPTSWTLSTMIVCFCKKSEPDEARRMLDLMLENGFSPNVTTYTIIINCFSRSGRLQKAFEIFDIMGRTKCNPSVQTYNCLISGLCYVGRVEDANELLTKIKRSSIKPDIYTFTAVMDGLCKVGRSDEGMELLEEALKLGLEPNVITYNTLFDGFCREGRPLKGIDLLIVMEQANCQPDFITYSTLLSGLLKWKQTSAGLQVYKKMTNAGFLPEGQTMNNLLKGISRKSLADEELLSDSLELFQKLRELGYCPNPYTYHLIIQNLAIRGQTCKALDMLHEMVGLRYPVTAIPIYCLVQALCNEGRVNEAWMVLMLMIQAGRLLGRNIYKLLFDEFNRQGRLLDAHKMLGFALKRGINLYSKPEKTSP